MSRRTRYRLTKKRPAPCDEAGPSGRSKRSAYDYNYYGDCNLRIPVDLEIDRAIFQSATEEQRETVTETVCQISLICQHYPKILHQILCILGPIIPGMVKDPRSIFEKEGVEWDIKPTRILNGRGQVVAWFWHRGLEAGIRAQSPSTIDIANINYYLHVDKVPLPQIGRPDFQAWVVLGMLLDATGEPGEPFVVSMLCGDRKPSASVLLGPVCREAAQLRRRARERQTADIKARAVLADAEARALVKETVAQNAHHGCTKCTIEGVSIGNKISFHDNTAAQPRTHASFVENAYYGKHYKSRLRRTLELLDIDLIKDVSIADDRHLINIGATKTFFRTFTLGLRNAPKMPIINLRLLHHRLFKVRFPVEREDQKFSQHIGKWPPSMWAYFTDVVGCVVLKHVLREFDYLLFCRLHFAVAICNHKRYSNLLGYAEKLFKKFVEDYYRRVKFVPCSIHYLLHVVDEIREFRSLANISTNNCESALSILSANVDTAGGERALKQGGTALMIRECVRNSPASKTVQMTTPTLNGGRVVIRPKFQLISDSISLTDANSWFLTTTGKIVKFKSASVDNLGLVVLGQELHEQYTSFIHQENDVPLELNFFNTPSKGTLETEKQYRINNMIAKLCVVDFKQYTWFVPLPESLPDC